jgi:exopolyphosphatase/guanosine-5'-triphosphate,3'-diphosphate pyrophosphatase
MTNIRPSAFGLRISPGAVLRPALIDIGSSSIRLLIAERHDQELRVLEHLRNALPIGADTFVSGTLSQGLINQALVILRKYQEVARGYDVTSMRAFATTAVREAHNRDVFLDIARRKTGLAIEVLTAGDVVYYISSFINTRLQQQLPIRSRNIMVAEFGAGTAEFSLLRKGLIVRSTGLPLGALRLAELRGSSTSVSALGQYIASELQQLKRSLPKIGVDEIVLISETLAYSLPALLGAERFTGSLHALSRDDARELVRLCAGRSTDELSHEYRIHTDTAEATAILSLALEQLFAAFEWDKAYVLETSLLEAIVTQLLFEPGPTAMQDRRRQLNSLAISLLHKYDADLAHARQVVMLSRALFQGLRDFLGLPESTLEYLVLAAYLHDIGKFISTTAHHKHAEYIISSLNLFQLTEEEQKLIASVARHHRGNPPGANHPLYSSLGTESRILVQKLSALLRIADSLDRSHDQKVRELRVVLKDDAEVELHLSCRDEPVLERLAFKERRKLFEDITGSSLKLRVLPEAE